MAHSMSNSVSNKLTTSALRPQFERTNKMVTTSTIGRPVSQIKDSNKSSSTSKSKISGSALKTSKKEPISF